jgi:hypothetical protein
LNKPEASELIPGEGISIVSSGDNYVISTSGSGGSSYQQEVSHDNTLSGNGTPESPLGLSTDLIVITEEELGTYTVGTSDTNINGTFSKAGYKPIAFTVKFGYSASINFNSEYTKYKSDNSLYIQGYAKVPSGSLSTKFTAIITWMKIS